MHKARLPLFWCDTISHWCLIPISLLYWVLQNLLGIAELVYFHSNTPFFFFLVKIFIYRETFLYSLLTQQYTFIRKFWINEFFLIIYQLQNKLALYRPPKVTHIFLRYVSLSSYRFKHFFMCFDSFWTFSQLWWKLLQVGPQVFLIQP